MKYTGGTQWRPVSGPSEGARVGTLFVVATPIGNLSDMTPRAVEVLGSVSLIAAEDTRHTLGLLRHFGIETPLLSYHAFNERVRRDRLLDVLARGDVALVTDAGTPAISDPGNDLVATVLAAGFPVSPIPGASSLVAAVSASGLVPGPFVVLGFLARKGRERAIDLGRAASTGMPLVLFEAPGRLADTLAFLRESLGDRPVTVARELTKVHEEIRHGPLSIVAEYYRQQPPRGEIVIVVGGTDDTAAAGDTEDDDAVIRSLLGTGLSVSQAAREAASLTGRPRSELYDVARRLRAAGQVGLTPIAESAGPEGNG